MPFAGCVFAKPARKTAIERFASSGFRSYADGRAGAQSPRGSTGSIRMALSLYRGSCVATPAATFGYTLLDAGRRLRRHGPDDLAARKAAIAAASQIFVIPDEVRRKAWGFLRHRCIDNPTHGHTEAIQAVYDCLEAIDWLDPDFIDMVPEDDEDGEGEGPPIGPAELGWLLTVLKGWD